MISHWILVKLQTDTVFAEYLSNFYDELLISWIFFLITLLKVQPFIVILQKLFWEISQNLDENTCSGLSVLIQLQALGQQLDKKGLQQIFYQ